VSSPGLLDGWSTTAIPDLSGRTAVVTGVTGGLGHHTVLELARHGAHVLATARDTGRGQAAVAAIREQVRGASVELVELDLADLASVRRRGAELVARHPRIEIAVNNAGIMAVPHARTVDGFELQMGTNHLGHFLWTGALWPALVAGQARVVAVSSLMHRLARGIRESSLRPDDGSTRYRRWPVYAESKLANLAWAIELHRRVSAVGLDVTAVAAHPGYSGTELVRSGPGQGRRLLGQAMHQATRLVAQPAEAGVWPLLAAATTPELSGGSYVGPGALNESRGRPTLVGTTPAAQDQELGEMLWRLSQQATGIAYP
jgi:NAD(P)-dependent dehydrogenase (short-subunit alcohol dehydrogenase family)